MLTRVVRIALLFAALTAICLNGQGLTGNLSGTVSDPSGAPVAGAEVVLTNVSTNQVRALQTDNSGDFVFTQLLPSTYKIQVSSKGFKRYEQTDIGLTATERLVLKRVELQLGEITQTIEVTAETARLQT